MNQTDQPSLRDKVAAAIAGGRVKMRPRWQFVLAGGVTLAGTVMVLLALVYLASFIVFSLRQSGAWFVPAFGWHGVGLFVGSLPWVLIGVAIIFIILLEVLVRRYSFAYRQPLLYTALGIVLVVTVGGIATARAPFHRGFLHEAERHHLPLAGPLYRDFGMGHLMNVHPGVITELTPGGFTMRTRRDESLTVTVTHDTEFPLGTNFHQGDMVVVVGERQGDVVVAQGVRTIDDDWDGDRSYPRTPPYMFNVPFTQ